MTELETVLPVVLVHGLMGSLRDPRLTAALEPHAVLAPDLLGYGEWSGINPERITLETQVEHLHQQLREGQKVYLVGHSVGGVVAVLFADRYPERVASLTSVEGNFTLRDAFMSQKMSKMMPHEVKAMLQADRADPAGWLRGKGILETDKRLEAARNLLEQQPGTTLHAMARSVVEVTGKPDYENTLRRVFGHHRPTFLVAGERSRAGWDVPAWALERTNGVTLLAGLGHFMNLENPVSFGELLAGLVNPLSTHPSQTENPK